jgi:hypothetical protein
LLILVIQYVVAAAAHSHMAAAAEAAAAARQGAVAVLSAGVLRTVNDSHSPSKAGTSLLTGAYVGTWAALLRVWRCWLVVRHILLQVGLLLALMLPVLLRL